MELSRPLFPPPARNRDLHRERDARLLPNVGRVQFEELPQWAGELGDGLQRPTFHGRGTGAKALPSRAAAALPDFLVEQSELGHALGRLEDLVVSPERVEPA